MMTGQHIKALSPNSIAHTQHTATRIAYMHASGKSVFVLSWGAQFRENIQQPLHPQHTNIIHSMCMISVSFIALCTVFSVGCFFCLPVCPSLPAWATNIDRAWCVDCAMSSRQRFVTGATISAKRREHRAQGVTLVFNANWYKRGAHIHHAQHKQQRGAFFESYHNITANTRRSRTLERDCHKHVHK